MRSFDNDIGGADIAYEPPGCECDGWWGRGDSNSHARGHMILNHARLPFRHFPADAAIVPYPPRTGDACDGAVGGGARVGHPPAVAAR